MHGTDSFLDDIRLAISPTYIGFGVSDITAIMLRVGLTRRK